MTILPPHNLEAEQCVCSGLMQELWCDLNPAEFYDSRHRIIAKACLELLEKQQQVDLVILFDYLKKKRQIRKVGGATYLAQIAEQPVSVRSMEVYARIVREAAQRRQLISYAAQLAETASDSMPLAEIFETAHRDLNNIACAYSSDSIYDSKACLEALKAEQALIASKNSLGFETGYSFVQETIKAARRGHFWLVGGYTSAGKSQFAVEIIRKLLTENTGITICLYSLEMDTVTYTTRLIASTSLINYYSILKNDLSEDEAIVIDRCCSWLYSKSLFISDTLYSLDAITYSARKLDPDIIIIDYVQNLSYDGSIYEQTRYNAPKLLRLAKDLNCTVIAMSQIPDEAVEGKKAIKMKGGGDWAACADYCLWLERNHEEQQREMTVYVRKNRHGPLGRGKMSWNSNWTRLREV